MRNGVKAGMITGLLAGAIGLSMGTYGQERTGLGLTAENLDQINALKTKGSTVQEPLPAPNRDIDLSIYLPFVQDQGQIESCTAFSISEAISIRANYLAQRRFDKDAGSKKNSQYLYSAQYLWTDTKANFNPPKNSDCGKGINFSETVTAIYRDGVVKTDVYPYEPDNLVSCYKPKIAIDVARGKADKKSRFTFEVPDQITKDNFLYILRRGFPICIAVHVDQYFDRAEHDHVAWDRKGNQGEQHAMVIVGYNIDKKCFKVLNSHGDEKGDHGYIWLNEQLVDPDPAKSVIYQSFVCGLDDQLANGPENGAGAKNGEGITQYATTIYDNNIDPNGWMKPGYYRIYNDIRFGVSFLNKSSNKVLLQIVDNKADSDGGHRALCSSQFMTPGESFTFISPNGLQFKVTLLSISHRGNGLNVLHWSAGVFAIELLNKEARLTQMF
ncbi:MAG: C1 family peptidase [Puia sp.]|nr:C1 family peptidase [Puia sp.]